MDVLIRSPQKLDVYYSLHTNSTGSKYPKIVPLDFDKITVTTVRVSERSVRVDTQMLLPFDDNAAFCESDLFLSRGSFQSVRERDTLPVVCSEFVVAHTFVRSP